MEKKLKNNEINNWKKVLYIISAGQFFSIIGSSMVQFAIVWWLTMETNSAIVLTIASMVGFLPQAILGPFVGAIVDRNKRKLIMIYADIAIAMATLILIIAFFIGRESLSIIYIVLIIRSIGSAFHMPAMQASIPMIVPQENLSVAASVIQFIQSASNIFGPALAAFMLSFVSIEYVMLVDIIGAIIACISIAFVNIPNPIKIEKAKNESFITEVKYGFKELKKHKALFILTIILSMVAVIYIPIGSLFPLIVSSHFNGGAVEAGFAEIAFAVGMLIGSTLIGIIGERYKKVKIIGYSVLLSGIALTISGLLPSNIFIGFLVMSALIGLSGPLYSASFYVLIQSSIEPSILGRVIGIVNSIMLFATPIGLLIAGPMCEIIGVDKWFLLSGVLTSLISVVSIFNSSINTFKL
ncbi:MAG: MFS transporter [Clostridium beijerinckii]|jgi:MFS transporter, DHA3 family, macrolide efflux protein|nr:MFS transporter [Clostridium beijerinckii]